MQPDNSAFKIQNRIHSNLDKPNHSYSDLGSFCGSFGSAIQFSTCLNVRSLIGDPFFSSA